MANIDRIVNATILLQSTAVDEQSFSDMLILADHAITAARVTSVNSTGELEEMGVAVTSPLYRAVQAAKSQTPSVDTVYIGRRMPAGLSVNVSAPKGSAGEVFSVTVEYHSGTQLVTQPFAYTTVGDATDNTAAKLAPLLAALIDANTSLTATATGSAITIVGTGEVPAIVAKSSNLAVNVTASTESVTSALNACRAESDKFYGVGITSKVLADQMEAAAWIESNGKLGGFSTKDTNAYNPTSTTDLAGALDQKNYFRSFVCYGANSDTEYPELALMSKKFCEAPGGETWANVTLGAVTADKLRESEAQALFAKNANSFEPFRNVTLTQNGKTAGGEWIDIIRFRDWLLEQIRVNVFSLFIDRKIAFTDEDVLKIKTRVMETLNRGVDAGGIAPPELDENDKLLPSYVLTVERVSKSSINDKANRKYRGVKFRARLAGAIHATDITGTLAYEL
ncbi:putative major tail protein [Pseudomonas phage POR1]|uniref:Putative major tail protein n=1 Tax=Pseudomonas phage POR1 TaxID=1718594 RepID=A0A0N9SJA3_9CAUD|nr:putative major tail protein [Pseudomonas phage POR1]